MKHFKFLMINLSLPILALTAVQADSKFKDRYGSEIDIKIATSGSDFTKGREISVAAFSRAYERFPATEFNPSFKTQGDVIEWIASVYDQEVELFKSGKTLCFQAFYKTQQIGVIFFEKVPTPENSIYIRQTSVLPEFQNRGIGKRLVFSVRDDPRLVPTTNALFIIFRTINTNAIQFYSGLGFKKSSYMHPGYDPKKYSGLEWHAGNSSPLAINSTQMKDSENDTLQE